jgi:hypothetical protein
VWNLVADIAGGTRLRVSENKVLRKIFGSKGDEVTGDGENYMRSLMICTSHPILFG